MTIEALIQAATRSPLSAEQIQETADSVRVSVDELYDLFAKRVAQRYLSGELSYSDGDAAMTELFGYATAGGGPELSRLAWQVFDAFDQSEYVRPEEPAEQQGEVKTRMLLAGIGGLRDA